MLTSTHIHVMIVHLPIIGTALAAIPLVWGWYKKDTTIQLVGLVLMGASLIGLPVAMGSGEETFEKFMTGQIVPDLDDTGAHYAFLHYQAAENIAKIGYFALVLVLSQIVFWSKNFRHKKTLFIITILVNFILIIGFGYVGYLGGKIRHPELRASISSEVAVPTLAK